MRIYIETFVDVLLDSEFRLENVPEKQFAMFQDSLMDKDGKYYLDSNLDFGYEARYNNIKYKLVNAFQNTLNGFPFDNDKSYDFNSRFAACGLLFKDFKRVLSNLELRVDCVNKTYDNYLFSNFLYPKMMKAIDYLNFNIQINELKNILEDNGYMDGKDFDFSETLQPYSPYSIYYSRQQEPSRICFFEPDTLKSENINNGIYLELYNSFEKPDGHLESDDFDISHLVPSIILRKFDKNEKVFGVEDVDDKAVEENRVTWDSIYDFLEDAPKILDYSYLKECMDEDPYQNPALLVSNGNCI